MSPETLIIGTRGSDLALWQAREAARRIAAPTELKIIKTSGDRFQDAPLQGQEDQGFFTKEIEGQLLAGEIDLAVHSLKDLPVQITPGLAIGAYLPRAAPSDLLIVNPRWHDPSQLIPAAAGCPAGATSLRRQALLKLYGPQCAPAVLRGNVPGRVAKCAAGTYGAIILARAGVERLKLDTAGLIVYELNPEVWLPAPGQAAVALESRAGDSRLLELLAPLDDGPTRQAVELERRLLANFEGGCHTAFGAWARPAAGQWEVLIGLEGEHGWGQQVARGTLQELAAIGPASGLGFAPRRIESQEELCRPLQL